MKLIRRLVAQLIRDAGTKRAWFDDWRGSSRQLPIDEIELQLGHQKLANTSDLYPPSLTELNILEGRSHWTCLDTGWEEVADLALDWAVRHARKVHGSEASRAAAA